MILIVDIGNTYTNFGLFEDGSEDVLKSFWIPTKDLADEDKLLACLSENIGTENISGAIIGSVVKDCNNRVSSVLRNKYNAEVIKLDYKSKLPISLKVDFPEKLGVDRIVNGAFGFYKYNQAVIVIDCGSAITFDIVNKSGEFLGGAIALGLKNQLKAISSYTSALPMLELEPIESILGKNTKDAILSGVLRGTARMIDGMIEDYVQELGTNIKVVLTGGDSKILAKYLKTKLDLIDEKFLQKGLKYLYKLNA